MEIEQEIDRSWYLIYTKPRQESVALDNLARQGYESYLPLFQARKHRRNARQRLVEPLFPRYLFIQLKEGVDNWSPIRSTIGVSSLVSFGFVPAKVPDELISLLKAGEDERGLFHVAIPELKEGDKVRVKDGVMYGYEGIINAKSGKDRVEVLLRTVSGFCSVQISPDQLELAS